MHTDHAPYMHFTGPARLDKAINSLLGLVEGIAIDGHINDDERSCLHLWLSEQTSVRGYHPFNELVPVVEGAVSDGILTEEEREDLTWLCERLRSSEFYDQTTADLQRLHSILGGLIADAQISKEELQGLSAWMDEHEHLKTCWPFDEIGSLITSVLSDGTISDDEHTQLIAFFSEFVALADDRTLTSPVIEDEAKVIVGLCAVCPDISFPDKGFTFTGASPRYKRSEFKVLVAARGGRFLANLSPKVDYLVIGSEGNPCWAYACYGRKVEQAIRLRKEGHRLLIVHENDFHDAIADTV
jgi:hypothetical protein